MISINLFLRRNMLLSVLAMAQLTVTGNPAIAADLLDVYDMAINSDPQYRQVAAAKLATLEQYPQALSQLLPSINLSANTRTNDQDISTQGFGEQGDIEFNSHGWSLDIRQPLFRLDRFIQLRQASSHIKQADAELTAAQLDLIVRVAENYFNVLAAKDNLEFAYVAKRSLGRQLEQAKQRFEVGLTAITDVQEAQAGYDMAVAEEIEARNNVDNNSEELREITGSYPAEFSALGEFLPLARPEPDDIDAWTEISLQQNLDIIAALSAIETARKEIKVQQSGHLPTLDLVGRRNYIRSGGRFGAIQIHSSMIGLELNVPIFQGGLVSSRTRESRQRLEEQLQRLEQVRRQAQRLTRQAYLGVISGISRVKALKQAVISSETALQATEAGFEVGTRTAVDVVASERATSQSRRNYAQARYDYILNTLRLKRSAGILSLEDLANINHWLN